MIVMDDQMVEEVNDRFDKVGENNENDKTGLAFP